VTGKKLTPAIFYGRVSEDKGGKRGDSLRSQEAICREYARHAGLDIQMVFTDSMTGGNANRPGFNAMLKFLLNHPETEFYIVIDSIDRFARDIRGHWDLRDLLREAGGRLVSPKMEFKDDADSVMVENIHATFAQHFRQKNAEQTLRRMRARLLNGFWPFQAPVGYKYVGEKGRGRVLVHDEPAASIVQEALEGFCSDRFGTQADVMRYLQEHPLFPKDSRGIVRNQRVSQLLRNPLYAGYVEAPKWDIALREGRHEGLISFRTFKGIQDKLDGKRPAVGRTNRNEDFVLRGHVLCDDCSTPLTGCWSRGHGGRYAYYLCPKRGCASYGKSIRRDVIEGDFEKLLHTVQPNEKVFAIAQRMLRKWWDGLLANAGAENKAIEAKLAKIDRDIEKLLERIIESDLAIATYEKRVGQLEQERIVLRERLAKSARQPAISTIHLEPRSNSSQTLGIYGVRRAWSISARC
jgi:DNA invertase Pin-like site-specific DNA recombinase